MAGRIAYYGNIVRDGLVLNLDAAKQDSYPGSGTVWRDIAGGVITGSLINGPTFNPNNFGSIVFDGVNDNVAIQSLNLSNTNRLTVSFWCRIVSYVETPSVGRLIFEVSTNFNNVTTGFVVAYADDSNPAFLSQFPLLLGLRGDNGYTIPAFNKNLVNDLQWHHYSCIFDKSQASANDECQLYLDGILRTPSFYPNGLMSNNTNNFGDNLIFLGSRSGGTGPGNVQISNFCIYNRVLTQAEITQNYNATKGRYGL